MPLVSMWVALLTLRCNSCCPATAASRHLPVVCVLDIPQLSPAEYGFARLSEATAFLQLPSSHLFLPPLTAVGNRTQGMLRAPRSPHFTSVSRVDPCPCREERQRR